MNVLAWYDAYVGNKLEVIPLRPRTKIPYKWWDKKWNSDWNRNFFCDNPYSNMGFRLGTIMDIEGDTPEANEKLMKITANCPHPMYSSSRSIHHLFLNPDPTFTIVRYKGMEFRGAKHQSVLPPSRHEDGKKYFWLPESRFPIPKMPTSVLNLFKIARQKKKPGGKKIHCFSCEEEHTRNFRRINLEIEAFKVFDQKWQCQGCRTIDVRPICREIRKRGL